MKTNSENNYSANISWNLNEKDEKMNGQKSEKNFSHVRVEKICTIIMHSNCFYCNS